MVGEREIQGCLPTLACIDEDTDMLTYAGLESESSSSEITILREVLDAGGRDELPSEEIDYKINVERQQVYFEAKIDTDSNTMSRI